MANGSLVTFNSSTTGHQVTQSLPIVSHPGNCRAPCLTSAVLIRSDMAQLFSFVLLLLLYPCVYSKPHNTTTLLRYTSVPSESVDRPDRVVPGKDFFRAKGNQSCFQLLKDCTEYVALLPSSSSLFVKSALALGLMQVGCLAETDQFYLDLLRDEDTRKMFHLLTEQLKASKHQTSAQRHSSQKHVLDLDLLRFNLDSLSPVAQPTHQHCSGFQQEKKHVRLNGLDLGVHSSLQEAQEHCDRLGPSCAGVSSDNLGEFHSVARYGGHIMPQIGSKLWLRHCATYHLRRRSTDPECHSESELNIHNVMQWVPLVGGYYNAGSAIYYATQGCSAQAEDRALEAAIDLSYDALITATGGASGAVGVGVGLAVKPALKAGMKAIVDYFQQSH